MPLRASMRKARLRSAHNTGDSLSFSFQNFNAEIGALTEEQVSKVTQRRENKWDRKMKDEIKKSENNIVRALNSLTDNSSHDGYTSPVPKRRRLVIT